MVAIGLGWWGGKGGLGGGSGCLVSNRIYGAAFPRKWKWKIVGPWPRAAIKATSRWWGDQKASTQLTDIKQVETQMKYKMFIGKVEIQIQNRWNCIDQETKKQLSDCILTGFVHFCCLPRSNNNQQTQIQTQLFSDDMIAVRSQYPGFVAQIQI